MDYDDNDAQDQNLHLAVEESSKVTPLQHPYALPKFDFEDSLQGHLRFDSLVENEVFLGITGQEDNQWIEEYSRGASEIQFSSSAAESRRKNVWSEATSSESVEMLLKSVGQEEKVLEETIIEQLDANVMDPNMNQCDGMDHLIITHSATVPNEHQEEFVGSKVSSDFEQSHATFATQSQEAQISHGELDSVVGDDKYSLAVCEKKVDRTCDDGNQKEASNSANESFINELQEGPSVLKVECGIGGSSQNVDASVEDNPTKSSSIVETCTYSMEKLSVVSNVELVCNTPVEVSASPICSKIDQEFNDNIREELIAVSPNGGCIEMQGSEDDNTKSDIPDSPNSNVGSLSNPSHLQSHSVEETKYPLGSDGKQVTSGASMVSSGNKQFEIGEGGDNNDVGKTSEMHSEERSNKDEAAGNDIPHIHTGDPDDEDPNLPTTISGLVQVGDGTQLLEPVATEGGDINDVGKTSVAAGSSAEMLDEEISDKDEIAGNDATSVHTGDSNNEDQSLPANISGLEQVGDETQLFEGCDINDVDKTSVAAGSSAEMHAEEISNKDETAGNDTQNVHTGDSKDEDQNLPANISGLVQVIDETRLLEPDAIPMDQDATFSERDDARFSSDFRDMEMDVVGVPDTQQNVEPSSFAEDGKVVIEVAQGSESNMAVLTDAVAAVESSKISSPDLPDGVQLPSGTVPTAVIVTEDQPRSPILGVSLLHDANEESAVRFSSEQTSEDNPGGIECPMSLEKNPRPCDSSTEEGNNVDAGGLHDPKESVTKEDGVEPLNLAVNMSDDKQASVDVERDANHVVQNGGDSASLDKPQIFSFSDTNNIELPKMRNDREGLQTASSSSTRKEESFTFEVNASASSGQIGIQNLSLSKVSSLSSGGSQLVPKKLHKESLISPQTPVTEAVVKGNSERKPRRKSVGKGTANKGNHLKDTTPTRRSERAEISPALLTPPATVHGTLPEELKPNESNPQPSVIPPIPTSNSPDLNNSISVFQQSFTDNQQVQLRAQILVYGSLISRMPPEESHMIAAFGQYDGGRKDWEAAWHACLERFHGRKSQANNPDTPMQPRPDVGNRDPDQGTKVGTPQSKILSPLASGPSGISSTVVSPAIPIPSPLWNVSTPFDGLHGQTLSPLHPYQTPGVQKFAGHNPSWLSQGHFPIAAFSARFSPLPITESVKLTTVKESGAAGTSVTSVDLSSAPSVSLGSSSLSELKKAMISSDHPSSDSKSKKRKKVAASVMEGHNQISFVAQNQTNSATAPVISSHSPTSNLLSTPVSITSKNNRGSFLSAISPASTHGHSIRGDQNMSKIEESKVHAADAAVHAAAAVSHCQSVWSQLERQKNSGLVSDDEAKLASSAVAIAAAASVAKVAAAAAKIASNVAEQAKLMADEVFLSGHDQSSMISHMNVLPNSDKAKSSDHPTSIISTAREAARRRIEAASAASKHAENLDAIVKAAELAAEAVSQAGKIVAMGNPLPLKDLAEAGPEGYWKNSDKQNVEAGPSKEIQTSSHGASLQENQMMITDGISGSITSHENDRSTARARKGLDSSKIGGVIPESKFESLNTSDVDQTMPQSTSGTWKENNIKEGCLVEVCKDYNKNKGAWFAANVLTLKDGKAFVCYTEIQSDEGSGQLKEWVPLEVEGTETPIIRIAHPTTIMRSEGTRKRSRTALTDYAWCSGDRVDVWMQDNWREAVVMKTNKIDLTSLTVQFPDQGETSVVRSWHVRPTLIWKDGKWIEWSSLKASRTSEGGTPQGKRMKKDKSSDSVDLVESGGHQESIILPLHSLESSFHVGKSSKGENKQLITGRTMRSGLQQKERPRVVFGVPKPGKKQKFMDVSKHYVANGSNKNNTPNDSVKLSSSSIPKEKQESKMAKSRKPPVPSVRTLAQKDKTKSSKPISHDGFTRGKTVKDSVGVDENLSVESSCNVESAVEGTTQSTLPSEGTSTSKGVSQRLNKRKFTPGNGNAAKVEVKEKSTAEVEPRRSNRKIQPTSRLLEGLQSSLAVSKIPSFSHASQRSHNKVTSKGNVNLS